MRVFIAGASGVVGRHLIPMLVKAGHQVVGTSRHDAGAERIHQLGASPVTVDPLQAESVHSVVEDAKPDVVIHQLTALSGPINLKDFEGSFAKTNKLRTTGLDLLLSAAVAAGATRFIAQSYTGWPNQRSGTAIKTEEDPIDPDPEPTTAKTVAAIAYLEETVPSNTDIDGLALRYGALYGPGTGLGVGGDLYEMVASRKLPLVGGGAGVWSHLHIEDAATATVAALQHGDRGVYNIVDDEPAPVYEWLPHLADAIGAKPPMRLPAWLARPMIGGQGVSVMTKIRGSSNAKAKRELGWTPIHPTWREGFKNAL
ncbi:MAG: NAD-dependent epimerase/dehydratase family protein [Acidimicrobiia bacterium]|nr:NAD-dependent epimerase/dehydratase family protein [Acidimicrobiia bacterium]